MHYIIEKRNIENNEYVGTNLPRFETKAQALDYISQELPDPENYRAVAAGWAWGGKRYPSKKELVEGIGQFVGERLAEQFGEEAGMATAPDGRKLELFVEIRLKGEGAQETDIPEGA